MREAKRKKKKKVRKAYTTHWTQSKETVSALWKFQKEKRREKDRKYF